MCATSSGAYLHSLAPGFLVISPASAVVCFKTVRNIYSLLLYTVIDLFSDIKAIDSVGDPPLPIPNREVKPVSADGTANIRGRVGHRHFYKEDFKKLRSSFFLLLIPLVCLGRWYCEKREQESRSSPLFMKTNFSFTKVRFFA